MYFLAEKEIYEATFELFSIILHFPLPNYCQPCMEGIKIRSAKILRELKLGQQKFWGKLKLVN